MSKDLDFIKSLYDDKLIEQHLDEDAIQRIQKRVDARELALYAIVVGKTNAARAKIFIELALNGKSIPSQYVKGYEPALDILNDIITAGPTYITQLKHLHQRAKRRR